MCETIIQQYFITIMKQEQNKDVTEKKHPKLMLKKRKVIQDPIYFLEGTSWPSSPSQNKSTLQPSNSSF